MSTVKVPIDLKSIIKKEASSKRKRSVKFDSKVPADPDVAISILYPYNPELHILEMWQTKERFKCRPHFAFINNLRDQVYDTVD